MSELKKVNKGDVMKLSSRGRVVYVGLDNYCGETTVEIKYLDHDMCNGYAKFEELERGGYTI